MIEVVCADVIDWAREYQGEPFHAMLTDSPYEMSFMSRKWDGTGISFQPSTWAALAEHLLPGAWGMSFASSRGWHRLAVAIEDSGLRIHPSIFLWAQGSGFCKATNIHAQLEKRLCYQDAKKDWFYRDDDEPMRTKPPFRHPRADRFYGHRYGGQVLAPKVEPIIVFQKPYEGKPIDCIVETGAGALNIEQGRIGAETVRTKGRLSTQHRESQSLGGGRHGGIDTSPHQGRWPSNFVLSHVAPDASGNGGCVRKGTKRVKGTCRPYERNIKADSDQYGAGCGDQEAGYQVTGHADADGLETVDEWQCQPQCPVRRIGEQGGKKKSGGKLGAEYERRQPGIFALKGKTASPFCGSDGTAARFYFNAEWSYEVAEKLAESDPVHYMAKASRRERDAGLSGKPKQFLATMGDGIGEREHNPKEPSAWVRNNHPCIKPLSLCKWIATLLLPPPEYAPRRILVPFSGSGSEAIGAMLAGWEEIVAIELGESYCEIGRARLHFWQGWSQSTGETDPKTILKLAKKVAVVQPNGNDDRQLDLFEGGERDE